MSQWTIGPRAWIAAVAAAVLLPAAALAQYKWIDADGKVTYGDSPPRDAKKIERLNAPAEAPGSALLNLPFELRRAVENFPVQVYTTADCNACQAGRELLRARGVPFEELTVATREDVELMRTRGYGDMLPVISIGRNALRQLNPDEWNRALDAAGYPRSSMLPRTWQNPPPRPAADGAKPTAEGTRVVPPRS
jgi:glutaredoxin